MGREVSTAMTEQDQASLYLTVLWLRAVGDRSHAFPKLDRDNRHRGPMAGG